MLTNLQTQICPVLQVHTCATVHHLTGPAVSCHNNVKILIEILRASYNRFHCENAGQKVEIRVCLVGKSYDVNENHRFQWQCQGIAHAAKECLLRYVRYKLPSTWCAKEAVLLPFCTLDLYCSAVVLSSDKGMKKISLWRLNSLVGAS